MKLSVIIPLYNEQDNVAKLISATTEHLKDIEYELILVDDGSEDNTVSNTIPVLIPSVKLLVLEQNYGQSTALKAGIDESKGKYIVFMDGDLQNNPSDVLKMMSLLEKTGAEIVQGYRKNRHDSILKKISSSLANLIIRMVYKAPFHDVGCSLKIFKRELLLQMIFFNGFHRFFPLIAYINGFKVAEIDVHHSPRQSGKSKYGISRIFSVVEHLMKLKFNKQMLAKTLTYSIKSKYEKGPSKKDI